MLMVSADVGRRYLLGKSLPGTYEVGQSLLVFTVFLALAHTQDRKGNIRIEVATSRLSKKGQLVLDLLAYGVGLVFFGLITWETFRHFLVAYQVKDAAAGLINVPLYPARFAVSLGSFLLFIQYLIDIGKTVSGLRKGKAE